MSDRSARRTWPGVKVRPWVSWLKRYVGGVVAAGAFLGYATLGCSSSSGTQKLGPDAPLCRTWSALNSTSPNSARVEAMVFRRATRGPSAVYLRECGAAFQYRYIDTGTGRPECLADSRPLQLRADRWLTISVIPLYRCD